MGALQTLPPDFFDKQEKGKPSETLPPDFFDDKPPAKPTIGQRVQSFAKEHPYVTGAASILFPPLGALTPDVGKGAAKTVARDAYGMVTGPAAGPVGMTLGVLGKQTGLTKKVEQATETSTPGERVGKVAATLGEMALPTGIETGESKVVDRLGKTLQESAEKGYSQVLNATTRGNKARSAEVVPGLLNRGVTALTLKGLGRKVAGSLDTATQELEAGYAGLPADAAIPAQGFASGLMTRAKDAFTANGKSMSPQSDTALSLAKELGNRVLDMATKDANGNPVITVDVARKTRQIYDEISRAAGRFEGKDLADHSAGVVHGMAADSLREMLNQVAAGKSTLGALNQEYSFWRSADKVIQDTLLRRQGQARPLGQKLAAGAGAILGGVKGGPKGAALGYEAMRALEAATTSAAWKTTSAVMKHRLADAIASGNQEATSALANGIAKGAFIEDARHRVAAQ